MMLVIIEKAMKLKMIFDWVARFEGLLEEKVRIVYGIPTISSQISH
jgi:hypothetical protein